MTTNNSQPLDDQDADDQAVGEIQIFSFGARINRLRYWAHSALFIIPIYIVAVIGVALALSVSAVFWVIAVVAYIAMIVSSFLVMIQRLHDLDKSGWLSLLAFVPFANLYLMVLLIFIEGTKGRNRFGLRTPPNQTWHWIVAFIMPVLSLIAVIGVLAAVAIPQYQKFLQHAKHPQEASQVMDQPASVQSESSDAGASEGAAESATEDSTVAEPESEAPATQEGSESSKAPE